MSSFLLSCVDKYRLLVPKRAMFPAPTPYLAAIKVELDPTLIGLSAEEVGMEPEARFHGAQARTVHSIGAQILMKVLYAARMARPDLLHSIQVLAASLTKWDDQCDAQLHRLVCYIHGSLDLRQMGWIGDSAQSLALHLSLYFSIFNLLFLFFSPVFFRVSVSLLLDGAEENTSVQLATNPKTIVSHFPYEPPPTPCKVSL